MRARWLAGLLSFASAVAVVGSGCGELDTADRVHDLRLLAMRAEPPEQVLPVAFLPDGGVAAYPGAGSTDGGTGGDGGTAPPRVPQPAPVTVTALLADPAGNGREVSYRFTTCTALDPDRRCVEGSPRYRVLAEGTVTPSDTGAEPSVTFTPDYRLLADLVRRDALDGFGGVNLPVQIEISAGDESVVGFKRVVFQFLPPPLPPRNRNPELQALDYNGTAWEPDATPEFFATERPTTPPLPGTGSGTDGGTQTGTNRVTPRVDPTQFEEYDRPTFDGEPVHFKESWRYNFYATRGTFSPASTGGGGNATTGNDRSTSSTWNTLEGQTTAGPMTVWVVVRDGRGGESWISRRAVAPAARR
ncbi:MAG TPA: hypothetical protein VK447_13170 [Myxococcaceae bacterium]|nr:hypothetical protein [Myxococcaceae bacterium]